MNFINNYGNLLSWKYYNVGGNQMEFTDTNGDVDHGTFFAQT